MKKGGATMFRPVLLTTLLLAAGLSAPALPSAEAQGSQAQQGQAGQPALSKADREFVEKAALGGLLEVRLGQLAQQRASTQDVKSFGQRMIDDHSAVNKQLAELAQRKGMAVPQALDKEHREKVDKLSKKTGAEFDRDYMSFMVDDHEDDIKAFEKASKEAKDADVKSFAAATLPKLREHLTQAKQVHGMVKGQK
jgi:putative membrane protein